MWIKISAIFIWIPFFLLSQHTKKTVISDTLKEISGLELLGDSVLIAHNDSGNEPRIYFLNVLGKIIHSVKVLHATNIDWEDLTVDEQNNVYIGDFGNNSNARKDLAIYYFSLDSIWFKTEVSAQKLSFYYEDQHNFPPPDSLKRFDCEALAYYQGSLYLFTKEHPNAFTGKVVCYRLNFTQERQVAQVYQEFMLPRKRRMILDGLTGADIYEDTCYLLTYSDVYIFPMTAKQIQLKRAYSFGLLSQKEAIVVGKQYLYVGNERSASFRKQKLIQLRRK